MPGAMPGNPDGATKADRIGARYKAFVPDPVGTSQFSFSSDLADALVRAETAVREVQTSFAGEGLDQLARQLLRAESVGSSRIEGLVLSQKRIFKAMFEPEGADPTAVSILGNIRAMERAIAIGSERRAIKVADLVGMHKELLGATKDAWAAGVVRTEQNWVGGSRIGLADFVPPPPNEVPGLLQDLCVFINRDDIPAVAQAAIAHAQYETIHPHVDGNGRVGRCLIHIILRRRGVATHFVPPISLVLATISDRYIAGLTEYRRGLQDEWCQLFSSSTASAAAAVAKFAVQMAAAQATWFERAGRPRRHSAAARLITVLPSNPVLDVRSAAGLVEASEEAARLGIGTLERAGIVRQTTVGRYRRAWAAEEVFAMMDGFEWSLATSFGGSKPVRPAPQRQ